MNSFSILFVILGLSQVFHSEEQTKVAQALHHVAESLESKKETMGDKVELLAIGAAFSLVGAILGGVTVAFTNGLIEARKKPVLAVVLGDSSNLKTKVNGKDYKYCKILVANRGISVAQNCRVHVKSIRRLDDKGNVLPNDWDTQDLMWQYSKDNERNIAAGVLQYVDLLRMNLTDTNKVQLLIEKLSERFVDFLNPVGHYLIDVEAVAENAKQATQSFVFVREATALDSYLKEYKPSV